MANTLSPVLSAERVKTARVEVTFTPREVAVLIATSQGMTQDGQAKLFGVARPTIITTCANVYGKLSAPKAAQAVRKAGKVGVLTDEDDTATRDDLSALWAAGDDWTKVGTAAPEKAAEGVTEAAPPKRSPRRSGRATSRKATGTEAAKLAADKVTAQSDAKRRG